MSTVIRDDFLGGSGSDGAVGKLGWRSGAGTLTPSSGTTDRVGVLLLTTGASANDQARIHLGRTVSTPVADVDQVLRWGVVVGLASTANIVVRAGWGTDVSSSTFGTDGVWWEVDSSGTGTWRLRCRSGGSTTAVDSGVAASTGYVLLVAYRQGSRWVGVVVEADGTETTVTSAGDEPSAAALNAGIVVETLTTAAKSAGVDSWACRYARTLQDLDRWV